MAPEADFVLVWTPTDHDVPFSAHRGIYREADDPRGEWAHWHTAEEAADIPAECRVVVGGPLCPGCQEIAPMVASGELPGGTECGECGQVHGAAS